MMHQRDPDAPFSGGGISFLTGNKNGRFSYGYSSFKGKRSSMEDFYETSISEVDGQMVAFFGVFDGHGGSRAAEYVKKNLFKNLSSHPDFINDTKTAIVEAFRQTDTDYLNEEKGQQRDAGTTASTAVLLGDRLLVANVGDSRVVACRAGSGLMSANGLKMLEVLLFGRELGGLAGYLLFLVHLETNCLSHLLLLNQKFRKLWRWCKLHRTQRLQQENSLKKPMLEGAQTTSLVLLFDLKICFNMAHW
ncbi:probable protein phosphatase 2C 11 isoform X7 [Magnolia sinica]|uniref:probable protein phosphatase 2C 11 isoform X7 n=1 Tax=Magnolia sinica TaxID=86752 RepID=UPI00265A9C65|nr:probable protein phosphatase 2C 11 isoform X7 [Magnolia sinica]